MDFLEGLRDTALITWVAESPLGFYLMLGLHAIGMATVVGVLLMVDLRVLGYATALPVAWFKNLFGIVWAGFALNLATGIVMLLTNIDRIGGSTIFQLKLTMVAVGGILGWLLWRDLKRAPSISSRSRMMAIISIAVWLLALFFGRLTAYELA